MNFQEIYDKFIKSEHWLNMLNVCENSPYHRESNVAEHTRMTLDFYKNNFANSRTPEETFATKVALLFHDTGKPEAATPREDRVIYRGHEVISANIFENFILQNNIKLDPILIRKIKWMIENHLPYNRKDFNEFRIDMTSSIKEFILAYKDMLISDACGRISDNPKIEKVQDYIDNLYEQEQTFEIGEQVAYILQGASGSGKTSLRKELEGEVFCLDELRLQFYNKSSNDSKRLYKEAFNFCNENVEQFNMFVQQEFFKIVKNKRNIILDAVFSSLKSRRKWIIELKKRGYTIIGIEFQRPFDLLIERQHCRVDKFVPEKAIKNQYYKRMLFRIGSEIDILRIV